MPLNAYALEEMVASRLAEARAAAGREALLRAARDEGADRAGWWARLRALLARWAATRSGLATAPPAALGPSGVYCRSTPGRRAE